MRFPKGGITEADLTPNLGWSFQSLRNDVNRRKHIVAVRADGTPWWAENSKEVYSQRVPGVVTGGAGP